MTALPKLIDARLEADINAMMKRCLAAKTHAEHAPLWHELVRLIESRSAQMVVRMELDRGLR